VAARQRVNVRLDLTELVLVAADQDNSAVFGELECSATADARRRTGDDPRPVPRSSDRQVTVDADGPYGVTPLSPARAAASPAGIVGVHLAFA
jgi:hypothetical protein